MKRSEQLAKLRPLLAQDFVDTLVLALQVIDAGDVYEVAKFIESICLESGLTPPPNDFLNIEWEEDSEGNYL